MKPGTLPASREDLRDWMVEYITSVLALSPEDISTADRFDVYGLDSVEAVVMAGVMEEHYGVAVDPMQFFDHPSIDDFAAAYAADAPAEPPAA